MTSTPVPADCLTRITCPVGCSFERILCLLISYSEYIRLYVCCVKGRQMPSLIPRPFRLQRFDNPCPCYWCATEEALTHWRTTTWLHRRAEPEASDQPFHLCSFGLFLPNHGRVDSQRVSDDTRAMSVRVLFPITDLSGQGVNYPTALSYDIVGINP